MPCVFQHTTWPSRPLSSRDRLASSAPAASGGPSVGHTPALHGLGLLTCKRALAPRRASRHGAALYRPARACQCPAPQNSLNFQATPVAWSSGRGSEGLPAASPQTATSIHALLVIIPRVKEPVKPLLGVFFASPRTRTPPCTPGRPGPFQARLYHGRAALSSAVLRPRTRATAPSIGRAAAIL